MVRSCMAGSFKSRDRCCLAGLSGFNYWWHRDSCLCVLPQTRMSVPPTWTGCKRGLPRGGARDDVPPAPLWGIESSRELLSARTSEAIVQEKESARCGLRVASGWLKIRGQVQFSSGHVFLRRGCRGHDLGNRRAQREPWQPRPRRQTLTDRPPCQACATLRRQSLRAVASLRPQALSDWWVEAHAN
jgi:hypothetical protein